MKMRRMKRFCPAALAAALVMTAGTTASAQCANPYCGDYARSGGHGCTEWGQNGGWYEEMPYDGWYGFGEIPYGGWYEESPDGSESESSSQEYSVSLQDIVDANTGVENLLGDHSMYGWTVISYDENGEETGRESYGVTREEDGYTLAVQSEDGTITTYRNGSIWIQSSDGSSQVREMEAEEVQALEQQLASLSFVGYSETETFTAETVQNGQLCIQSADPQGTYSDAEHMTCYYYAMDEDTLELGRLIETVMDADGNETKRTEVIVTTQD